MNRTKYTGLFAVVVAGLFAVGTATAGNIAGSAHDFSDGLNRFGQTGGDVWSSQAPGGQICIVCHAPHNNSNLTGELLWNRALAGGPFTPYTSPTLQGGSSVSGQSLLCLSCHDGIIALDSYGGGSADTTMIGGLDVNLVVGPDMGTDHPIGTDMAVAIAAGFDPTLAALTKPVTVGQGADSATGTIQTLLLSGTGTVECGSCHDPHNTLTIDVTPAAPDVSIRLLKVSNVGSALCLTCHEK